MSVLTEILVKAVSVEASDIHIKPGQPPFFRAKGRLVESDFSEVTPDYLNEIVMDILPPYLKESFQQTHEADFSLQEVEAGRFRVNIFLAQGIPTLALRHVKSKIPTFEELRLPHQLNRLAQIERGIVLITGTTGSGKSTTLAATIGEINRTQRKRIITVEDPVEYIFKDDQSIITQREIGLDTLDFTRALQHLMRQDPDVILIGVMRVTLSIGTALRASETGHLVLSTLHAGAADLAVPRMLGVFPLAEQDTIRLALASNLKAIVCQRLVPDTGGGIVPAVEILFNTPTVRKLLEKNQLSVIGSAIETGTEDGMQNFNQSIYELIKNGTIAEKEGMRHATNPESLRMNLQGIFLDEGKRILST